jgi:hypothetical protein
MDSGRLPGECRHGNKIGTCTICWAFGQDPVRQHFGDGQTAYDAMLAERDALAKQLAEANARADKAEAACMAILIPVRRLLMAWHSNRSMIDSLVELDEVATSEKLADAAKASSVKAEATISDYQNQLSELSLRTAKAEQACAARDNALKRLMATCWGTDGAEAAPYGSWVEALQECEAAISADAGANVLEQLAAYERLHAEVVAMLDVLDNATDEMSTSEARAAIAAYDAAAKKAWMP